MFLNVDIIYLFIFILVLTRKPASFAASMMMANSGIFGKIMAIVSPGKRLLFLKLVATLPHAFLNWLYVYDLPVSKQVWNYIYMIISYYLHSDLFNIITVITLCNEKCIRIYYADDKLLNRFYFVILDVL